MPNGWLGRVFDRLFGRRADDAGEAHGGYPSGPSLGVTRPATWDDVARVAGLLEEANVRYALIGGYALAANRLVRATTDIDLLVDASPDNAGRLILALGRLPDGAARALAGEERTLFGPQRLDTVRINDEITVDVMPQACGQTFEDLESYVRRVDVAGALVPVLNLEGLLLTKQGVREKDIADRIAIQRALAERKGS